MSPASSCIFRPMTSALSIFIPAPSNFSMFSAIAIQKIKIANLALKCLHFLAANYSIILGFLEIFLFSNSSFKIHNIGIYMISESCPPRTKWSMVAKGTCCPPDATVWWRPNSCLTTRNRWRWWPMVPERTKWQKVFFDRDGPHEKSKIELSGGPEKQTSYFRKIE